MDRGVKRVDEAIIGVRRKIHDDLRARRHSARDFDIEHDLGIGTVGVAGRRIARSAHRNRDDFGSVDAQLRKIFVELCGAVAAAELEDCNRLALAVDTLGKCVQRGDFERRESRDGRAWVDLAARTLGEAEMRLYARPVVQPEHALDDVRQIGGDADLAGADPERAPARRVALELDAERLLHRLDGPGEIDGALREAHARHDEPVRVRECLDRCDVSGIGSVQRPEFVVAKRPEMSRVAG